MYLNLLPRGSSNENIRLIPELPSLTVALALCLLSCRIYHHIFMLQLPSMSVLCRPQSPCRIGRGPSAVMSQNSCECRRAIGNSSSLTEVPQLTLGRWSLPALLQRPRGHLGMQCGQHRTVPRSRALSWGLARPPSDSPRCTRLPTILA